MFAQDHMYSQFFNSPLYLNPALTGQFEGDLRMNLIYRNQFTSVPGGFNYITASVDYNIPQFGGGVGLLFTRGTEGAAGLIKNNIAGIYSYSVGSEDYVLSFGLQAGITNRSVNYGKLIFSDQIDPQFGYIPGAPTSAEPPLFDNRFYFDAGVGINLAVSSFNIGGALQHINRPNESFTGTPAKLPIRGTAHVSYRWDLNPRHTGSKPAPSSLLGYGPAFHHCTGWAFAALNRLRSDCGMTDTSSAGSGGDCPDGHR